jgi:transglutaminase-like putative cysteine protease
MSVGGRELELVRVEQSFPKELHLDKCWHYLDPRTGQKVLSTEENSLFGLVTHERVGKDLALRPFDGKVKDREAPVTIDKPLPIGLLGLPGRLRLRVEMSDDDDPSTVFVSDVRQQLVKKVGRQAEFRLATKRLADLPSREEPKPGAEYLESNYYVRSSDNAVRRLAAEAAGDASEPRKKMERITQFVRKKVRGGYGVGFTTADEVARTLEGDCTEMGILSAAMGRAAGVPTRVAFGLVYDPDNPGFGGHLWTEAWVEGAWQTFDATGVLPLVGAAYLKIEAYSFKDVLNPDELNAVRRAFAGQMKVFVAETP